VAKVPGIRHRIRVHTAALEARVARVRVPERRARVERRLQPRIERLDALDERLGELVADYEQRCGPATT
jgi:hypothetical protein